MYQKKIDKCKQHGLRSSCELYVTLMVTFLWNRLRASDPRRYISLLYVQNNNDDAEDDDNQNMRKYIQNYSDTESHQLQHQNNFYF